jgi:hypothetical protein
MAQIYYSIGQHFEVFLLLCVIAMLLPYKAAIVKLLMINFCMYQVAAIIIYIIAQNHSIQNFTMYELMVEWGNGLNKTAGSRAGMKYIEWIGLPIVLTVNFVYLYTLAKRYNIKSDKLNNDDIFIFMMKPKDISSLIMMFFRRAPISGIFLYANGLLYCFKVGNDRVVKLRFPTSMDLSRYIILNTGRKIFGNEANLANLEGERMTLFKTCVSIFTKPIGVNMYKLIRSKA